MKPRFYPVWLLLVALTWCPSLQAAPADTPTNTLHSLWRVEGRSNIVYLLGSVHLLKRSDYPLAPAIVDAYTNSGIAVFETDVEKMQKMDTQFKMLAKATLPSGETLKDHLSPAVYSDFTNKVSQAGLPPTSFDQLKPSMAAMTLVVMEFLRLGADPELGLDQHFFKRAKSDGKRIQTLETVDFQIDLVTSFSREEGEALMKSLLEQVDETRKLYGEMVNAWKTGDETALEKMLNEALQESPAIYRRLLTDRNRRWIPEIEKLLQGGTNAIVIVGAGHLVGPEGVVELLRKQGARVTQL